MNSRVKKMDIILGMIVILFISGSLLIYPLKTTEIINNLKKNVMNISTPFYLWIGFITVVYSIYVCFSKYGNIRMGAEKPEYSTFSWLIMIFCTGMGSNLLYWSAIEWVYYYKAPPMGAQPFSKMAAELSATYGGFHWSITGWAIYAIGTVTLGLRYYNKKKPGLSLTDCCERAGGKKICRGFGGRIIELIFLFGTIGGYTTMISFVVPMYCRNTCLMFGFKNTFKLQVAMIFVITIIFTISSWKGLKNGIAKLSKLNIIVALILVITIIFIGPTMFIVKSMTNSIGYMFQNFIHMSLWTDPIKNGGFTENWTGFYWAWWIGLAPSMWIFSTKISKGRTVREIFLGMIISGSMGCWLYFGGISNYGLYQQLSGKLDLVNILETLGPVEAVSKLVLSLPAGNIMLFIWNVTGIIFLITTMDSGAYILSVSTTFGIKENEEPTKKLRLFWSLLLITIPIGFMYAGANMNTLQASAILTSLPIAVLIILTILSGYKYMRDELTNRANKENNKEDEIEDVNYKEIAIGESIEMINDSQMSQNSK